MEIYKNWFKSKSAIFASRFFRINTTSQIASLGTIRDIDWKEYEHITSFFAQNKKAKLQFPTLHPTPLLTHNQRYHKIIETLSLWIQKEIPQEVLEALAPTEMLLAKRSKQQDYTAPQEKGKDILIVGHGAMNSSIVCQIKNISIEKFWSMGLEQCKIIKIL